MRFKRAMAASMAAVMAVSSAVVCQVTASAAAMENAPDGTETVIATVDLSGTTTTFTTAWQGGSWTQVGVDPEIMKKDNVYVKVTVSNLGKVNEGTENEAKWSDMFSWGFSGYSWAGVVKWYNDKDNTSENFEVMFVPTVGSTAEKAVCYAPISDFALTSWNGIAGNIQAAHTAGFTLESIEIVEVETAKYDIQEITATADKIIPGKFDASKISGDGSGVQVEFTPDPSASGYGIKFYPVVDGAIDWANPVLQKNVSGSPAYIKWSEFSKIPEQMAVGGWGYVAESIMKLTLKNVEGSGNIYTGIVPVSTVTITAPAKTTYNVGDEVTLTASVNDDATVEDKDIVWSSDNTDVATVDEATGKVTFVGAGEAVITAAYKSDDTIKDTVTLTAEKKKVSATIVADAVTDATVSDAQSLAEEAAKATEIAGLTKDTDYTVKVKADGKKYTVTVALTEEGEKKYELIGDTSKEGTISYKVTGVKLSQDTLSILITNTDGVQLTPTIEPADLAEGEIIWEVADPTVASVENGLVKPVSGSAGSKTTITATVKGTEFKATCEVEITEVVNPAVKVVLDKAELSGTVGDKAKLTPTITAEDTTKACTDAVTWKSSNEKVAAVNAGTVTFVGEGTATITVTVGEQTATCTVTVKAKVVAVEKVTLDKTTAALTVGDTTTLKATVTPDNATDKAVTWTSSDETVATVKDGVVTAVKAGTATITAKAGDKTATCTVTVKDKVVAVEKVTLDKTSAELTVGDTTTLKATVTPDNATDKTVTWTSSDETIATVKDGVVTAVKAGTATITAKAGDKTATCAVTVKAKAGDVFSGKADIKPTDLKSWSDNVQIGATKVQEKSVIRIKYSIIDGKQHQIKVQDGAEWKTLTSIKTNEWGVTEVSKDGTLVIELNKADAEAITKGGLAITGEGIRVEDVDFNVVADSKKYGTGTETKTEFVRTTINADGTRNMLAVFSISAEDAKNYEAFLVTIKRGSDDKVFKDVVETFYDTIDYTIDGVMYEGTSENGKHLIVLNLVNADPNWGTITVNIEPTEVKG